VLVIQGCGGGGSVRRRNTLHEVGGRQYIVTSAVYGEREFILFHKIKKREKNIFYFRENKIFCERIKCENMMIYP
jgi:hypothetical protein